MPELGDINGRWVWTGERWRIPSPAPCPPTSPLPVCSTGPPWFDPADFHIPLPSDDDPLGDGIAAPGVQLTYSRGDHVHPVAPADMRGWMPAAGFTGQVIAKTGPGDYVADWVTPPVLSSTLPLMNGVASAGTNSVFVSRTDHVHPVYVGDRAGVTTGVAAAPGMIGERVYFSPSSVNITSNIRTQIGTFTLSPGDWDLNGSVFFALPTTISATTVQIWVNSFVVYVLQASPPLSITYLPTVINSQNFNSASPTIVLIEALVQGAAATTVGITVVMYARRMR